MGTWCFIQLCRRGIVHRTQWIGVMLNCWRSPFCSSRHHIYWHAITVYVSYISYYIHCFIWTVIIRAHPTSKVVHSIWRYGMDDSTNNRIIHHQVGLSIMSENLSGHPYYDEPIGARCGSSDKKNIIIMIYDIICLQRIDDCNMHPRYDIFMIYLSLYIYAYLCICVFLCLDYINIYLIEAEWRIYASVI